MLTGKYKDGIPADSRGAVEGYTWLAQELSDPDRIAKVEALRPLAVEMGATLSQFALAWCLQNPRVSTVLTGASRIGQLRENLRALDYVTKLTPDIMAEIDRIFD